MPPEVAYRQHLLKTQPARHAGRRRSFRESLGTLILGVLSIAIGVFLLIVLLAGIARRPFPGWSTPAFGSSASYYIPSKDCAIAAIAGECLGLAGVLLARYRHGTISLLSVLGTALCLLHISLFFLHVSVMKLL